MRFLIFFLPPDAKKKSRKKHAAANATAAQGIDTTAIEAKVPAASTDPFIQDSAQHEVSEVAEISSNASLVVVRASSFSVGFVGRWKRYDFLAVVKSLANQLIISGGREDRTKEQERQRKRKHSDLTIS